MEYEERKAAARKHARDLPQIRTIVCATEGCENTLSGPLPLPDNWRCLDCEKDNIGGDAA